MFWMDNGNHIGQHSRLQLTLKSCKVYLVPLNVHHTLQILHSSRSVKNILGKVLQIHSNDINGSKTSMACDHYALGYGRKSTFLIYIRDYVISTFCMLLIVIFTFFMIMN
jgi:hypothetical protein